MSHWAQAIADMDGPIQDKEGELYQLKLMVNFMCRQGGFPEKYPEIESGVGLGRAPTTGPSPKLQPDQFLGKPLNTAIKEVLLLRRAAQGGTGGTGTVEEIHAALVAGGFEFGGNKEMAINGLRISLGKSSHTFKKLTSGAYGLNEWYGIKPKPKTAATATDAPTVVPDGSEGQDTTPAEAK